MTYKGKNAMLLSIASNISVISYGGLRVCFDPQHNCSYCYNSQEYCYISRMALNNKNSWDIIRMIYALPKRSFDFEKINYDELSQVVNILSRIKKILEYHQFPTFIDTDDIAPFHPMLKVFYAALTGLSQGKYFHLQDSLFLLTKYKCSTKFRTDSERVNNCNRQQYDNPFRNIDERGLNNWFSDVRRALDSNRDFIISFNRYSSILKKLKSYSHQLHEQHRGVSCLAYRLILTPEGYSRARYDEHTDILSELYQIKYSNQLPSREQFLKMYDEICFYRKKFFNKVRNHQCYKNVVGYVSKVDFDMDYHGWYIDLVLFTVDEGYQFEALGRYWRDHITDCRGRIEGYDVFYHKLDVSSYDRFFTGYVYRTCFKNLNVPKNEKLITWGRLSKSV